MISEHWTFAGVDLLTYAYTITSQNADDLPPVRGQDAPYTGLHGRRSLGKLLDAKQVSLGIRVRNQIAAGGSASATQTRTNLDALMTVLASRGQANLVRTMPDASTRTALAECVIVQSQEIFVAEEYMLVAQFMCADPFFYGANVVDTSRTFSASPLAYTVTHPGTFRGDRVSFDILGPVTNPVITNSTTNTSVTFTGTVSGTTHLLIDCHAVTATNNGADVIGSMTHTGAVPFLTLDPGANSISITGSGLSAAGRVTTTFSPNYI